jgi:hypothetical protein
MDYGILFNSSTIEGSISDHRTFILRMKGGKDSLHVPLKFNRAWIKEEYLCDMVKKL